jgi:hypothetical protein
MWNKAYGSMIGGYDKETLFRCHHRDNNLRQSKIWDKVWCYNGIIHGEYYVAKFQVPR